MRFGNRVVMLGSIRIICIPEDLNIIVYNLFASKRQIKHQKLKFIIQFNYNIK